jgi:DNA-binding transcriptional regulator YhcF (GntR family)
MRPFCLTISCFYYTINTERNKGIDEKTAKKPLFLLKFYLIFKFMLAKIFGSNARVKILKTFLSKPEQKYYTRQLARDLELQVNSVRRELENLQNIGLIKQQINDDLKIIKKITLGKKEKAKKTSKEVSKKNAPKNEIKYFVADTNFLLFRELKNLFAKANLLSCQDFLKNIEKLDDITHLWLSGIFTGETKAPVDILIIGKIDKINKTQLLRHIKNLEVDLGKEINFTIMEDSEYEYRVDINDIFLYKFKQCHVLHEINREKEEEK